MTEWDAFFGVWQSDARPPFSQQTIIWERVDGEIRGRWIIQASEKPRAREFATGVPSRVELTISRA